MLFIYTARSLQDITRSYNGHTGYTPFDEETILYISLPLDAGWHALVDGQGTPIIHSCGMMAIRVPAGEHDIDLHYGTPYLKKGLLISIVSFLVFVAIMGLNFLRKKVN
ncbi:MAG: YfhO family protein [Butyrivibrio sp.]|nr:YfhO family protein [Clostridia bacterium]MBQ6409189.1 YfhO family protein [Butyrivibrio sp.]